MGLNLSSSIIMNIFLICNKACSITRFSVVLRFLWGHCSCKNRSVHNHATRTLVISAAFSFSLYVAFMIFEDSFWMWLVQECKKKNLFNASNLNDCFVWVEVIYLELKNNVVNPFTIYCHSRDLGISLQWLLFRLKTVNHCFETGLTLFYSVFFMKILLSMYLFLRTALYTAALSCVWYYRKIQSSWRTDGPINSSPNIHTYFRIYFWYSAINSTKKLKIALLRFRLS